MDQALKEALTQILGSRTVLILVQFAVGIGLMYSISKCFKFVEDLLADDTKLEIAVWLLGVKAEQKIEPWPETFARVFDRVFGRKHLSWKCFLRSSLASYASVICTAFFAASLFHVRMQFPTKVNFRITLQEFLVSCIFANVLPDYVSLLETRFIMRLIGKSKAGLSHVLWLTVDFVVTYAIGLFATVFVFWSLLALAHNLSFAYTVHGAVEMLTSCFTRWRLPGLAHFETFWFFPAFFTSIWLWLYAGSGFILKGARHFDRYLGWFNRRFDIEHKPLQSIGLVSGALMACVYWSAVIVSRVVK